MNKTKKNIIILAITIIIGLAIAVIFLAPSFKKINYRESVKLAKDEIGVNMQQNYIEMKYPPIIENDEIYLPINFVKKYIDEYIFWDENENKLTITNEHNVIRMQTEELSYFINNEPLKLDLPIYNIEGVAYMPTTFLEDFYSIKFNHIKQTNMLDIIKEDYKTAKVSKKISVRKLADKKSPIIEKLKKDSVVYYTETTNEEYIKIETEQGFVGYIPSKILKNEENIIINNTYEEDYEAKVPWEPKDGKINLVFDQMQNVIANSSESRRIYRSGLDVLVPTWFSFKDETGEIINIADKGYVNWAKSNGYQVWGLLTDNFDAKVSHSVLSSTKNREYVIKQLLAFVAMYDLDGINIDFESVPKKDGEYFIQFLRELAPLLKEQGAILSVDVFVPKPWTEHYNRKEVGKIADYVIVMGYDEHYAGSEKAGSVASLDWSKISIVDTLKQDVPKEKLILGVPFYTRVWTETLENGQIKLTSKAYGMNGAYKFIEEKNGKFVWDNSTGQYYGEAIEDNKTYRVWLEDEKSMESRLDLVLEYDIAGIGAWKKGLEKEEIWNLLEEKLKNN